jgi:hypothetical protein
MKDALLLKRLVIGAFEKATHITAMDMNSGLRFGLYFA